ncbi:MAG: zinc ribbon domain-containing protein [Clostridia bacterium]|nr:zinc ribbon domain-containing protein [Clostridia bacterium]
MNCKKCGQELSEDQKFCFKCGTPVSDSPEIEKPVESFDATADNAAENMNDSIIVSPENFGETQGETVTDDALAPEQSETAYPVQNQSAEESQNLNPDDSLMEIKAKKKMIIIIAAIAAAVILIITSIIITVTIINKKKAQSESSGSYDSSSYGYDSGDSSLEYVSIYSLKGLWRQNDGSSTLYFDGDGNVTLNVNGSRAYGIYTYKTATDKSYVITTALSIGGEAYTKQYMLTKIGGSLYLCGMSSSGNLDDYDDWYTK